MGLPVLPDLLHSAVQRARWPLLGWGLALFFWTGHLLTSFHLPAGPLAQGMGQVVAFLGALPTPPAALEGWLWAGGFALPYPLLTSSFAVWLAGGLLAGEERRRTLTLLLAAPMPRSRLLLAQYAALWLAMAVLGAWLAGVLLLANLSLSLRLAPGFLLRAVGLNILLALVWGSAAFLCGALTGRPNLSRWVGAGAFTLFYLLHRLSPAQGALAFISWLSPFRYTQPSLPGAGWVLAGLSGLCLAAAWVGFNRRDLEL